MVEGKEKIIFCRKRIFAFVAFFPYGGIGSWELTYFMNDDPPSILGTGILSFFAKILSKTPFVRWEHA